jgi:hypothetical protein
VTQRLHLLLVTLLVACGESRTTISSPAPAQPKRVAARALPAPSAAASPPSTPEIAARVEEAVSAYKGWGRVDELPGSAPTLCAYWPPVASRARRSDAPAEHGKKLYYLYASDLAQYRYASGGMPIGFAVVKESYRAVKLEPALESLLARFPELRVDAAGKVFRVRRGEPSLLVGEAARAPYGLGAEMASTDPWDGHPPPSDEASWQMRGGVAAPIHTLEVDGQTYRTGDRADLYVMVKVGEARAEGTDAGWIYAVLSPDGSVLHQASVLEQCAGCHAASPHDRLFGPPVDDDPPRRH